MQEEKTIIRENPPDYSSPLYSLHPINPQHHPLSPGARKLESIEPSRNRLRNIAIKIDKVLCAAIELNDPTGDVAVDELALCRVLKFGKLGRSAQDVAVAAVESAAGEARGDADGYAIGGDGGLGARARLVVEDAQSDLRGWRGYGDRRGSESQDGGDESSSELHFGGWVGLKGWKCRLSGVGEKDGKTVGM
jgi:hypothetical protein